MSVAYSDTGTEQQVKIGFIYNYTKFTTWPDTSSSEPVPVNVCIVGSQQLADKIVLLHNKKVNARTIQVRASQKQVRSDCNVLFISESELPLSSLRKNLLPLASLPILTISTIPNFVQAGGMIGLKILDRRVRFDINLLAVKKAGLMLNSQLLNLANEVIK